MSHIFDRVPFIVALNKIDKVGSNLKAVAEQLKQEGVLLEDQGGEVLLNLCDAPQSTLSFMMLD